MGLPDLTVDMDGVLCRPVTWFNLVISRDIYRPPALDPHRDRIRSPLARRLIEWRAGQLIRYDWRRPMPLVADGLAGLAEVSRLILLSGRPESSRKATERWLERHRLREYFSEIVLNDRGLSNAAFKLLTLRERGISHHVDDDGRVAYFLATEAPRTVFLIAWRRNAGLPYPPTVHRVHNLVEAADRMRQISESRSRES